MAEFEKTAGNDREPRDRSMSLKLAESEVERGVNDLRVAVFAILLGSSLTVATSVATATHPWLLWGAATFVGSFASLSLLIALLFRVRKLRHYVMLYMHKLTGQ